MLLTDTACRNAKPKEKPYKLADGSGLFLLVNVNGSKWWRLRYTFDSKEQMLSLGTYPDVILKTARDRRDQYRQQIAEGINPAALRQQEKRQGADLAAESFEAIAREWYAKFSPGWADTHRILRLKTENF